MILRPLAELLKHRKYRVERRQQRGPDAFLRFVQGDAQTLHAAGGRIRCIGS